MSGDSDSSSVEPTSPPVFGDVKVWDQDPKYFYTFEKMQSRGSTSHVYPCFCKRSHKKFAIKKTLEIDVTFMEIMVWSTIPEHPNIVGLIEAFIWKGYIYAVMELGESNLTNIIPIRELNSPMLPPDMVLSIIRQIILAVCHLHANNFAHGDLKSDNVVIIADGTIKLIDFGVATQNCGIHKNVPFCGTFSWKSPNSMYRDTAAPLSDDIWSMGITIGEIVGVDPPFLDQVKYPNQLIRSIRELQAPPALPDLKNYGEDFERKIHALLNGCLKMDPAERLTGRQLLEIFDENIKKN